MQELLTTKTLPAPSNVRHGTGPGRTAAMWLWLFLSALVVLGGCGEDNAAGGAIQCQGDLCRCSADQDCPDGQSCLVGFCADDQTPNNDAPDAADDDALEQDTQDDALEPDEDTLEDVDEPDGDDPQDAQDADEPDDVLEDVEQDADEPDGDEPDAQEDTDEPDAPPICEDDRREPNDRPAEAQVLTVASSHELRLCPEQEDWFIIRAERREALEVTVDTEALLNIDLIDFIDGQTVLASAQAIPGGYLMAFEPEEPGDFLLRVTSDAPQEADYSLRFVGQRIPCQDDNREDDDRPTAAILITEDDSPIEGVLCENDEDWFAIEIPGNFQIDVSIDFDLEATNAPVRIGLYNADEELIAQTNNISRDFSFLIDGADGGTYLLRVDGPDAEGPYTANVALSFEACDNDLNEPNDLPDEATIAQDEVLLTEQALCPNDTDWFAIELGAGQTLRADMTLQDPEADISIDVIAPDQISIISTTTRDGAFGQAVAIARQPGTHYVRVFSETSDRSPYELLINADPCIADAFEPNDTPQAARSLTQDLLQEGLRICDQDADWFVFDQVADTERVRITTSLGQGEGTLNARWFVAPDFDQPAGQDTITGEEDQTLIFSPANTADVYLEITGQTRQRGYSLSANVADINACQPDALEPDDDLAAAAAAPVAPGFFPERTICAGDFDYLCTTVPPTQTITATATFAHAEGDLELQLVNPQGIPLDASATDQDTEAALFTNNNPDDIVVCAFVVAQLFDLQVQNTYDLRVEVTGVELECADDDSEDNDTAATARALIDRRSTPQRPIPAGRIFSNPEDRQAINTLRDRVFCADDIDFFSFEARAGDTLEATATFAHADGDLDLTLYRAAGMVELATADTDDDNETVTATLPADGTYLLAIDAIDADDQRYNLDVALRGACVEDEAEPNENPDSASPITPGTLEGMGLCAREEDWYRVELEPGDTLTASLFYDPLRDDTDLELYGPNQNFIARSNSSGPVDRFTYTAPGGGTHYLRIYPFAADPVGASVTYDLDLQLAPEPDTCTPDPLEPNDDTPQRLDLGLDRAEVGGLTLCQDDTDRFSFLLLQPRTLFISATVPSTIPQSALTLTTPDNQTLQGQPVLGGRQIELPQAPAGLYTLDISRGPDGTIEATYDLLIEAADQTCVDDLFEPNDAIGTAIDAGEGDFPGLTHCPTGPDCYIITAQPGDAIGAQIAFEHRQGDLRLDLYDPGQALLATSNSQGNTETVLTQALQGGRHVACVSGPEQSAQPYDLKLIRTNVCPEDLFAPNPSAELAAPFPGNGSLQGTVCGDQDWFRVSTVAGQRLDIALSNLQDGQELDLRVFDAGLQLLAEGTQPGGNELIDIILSQGGDLLVAVESPQPLPAPYNLQVTLQDAPGGCAPDDFEPDDAPEEATALEPDTTYDATLCDAEDHWRVQGTANQPLIITATAAIADGQSLELDLFDATGQTLLASAQRRHQTLTLTHTPERNGPLIARVRPQAGYREGYTLALSAPSPVCAQDFNEPDDDTPVDLGSVTSGQRRGALCGDADVDRFEIRLLAGRELAAVLDFEDGVDLDLTLLNANTLQPVATSNTSSPRRSKETLGVAIDQEELYILQVSSPDPETQATYSLTFRSVAPPACPTDRFEDSDDFNTAAALPQGLQTGLSACSADEDWFFVELDAGQRLDIDLAYQLGGGDVELELLNINRQLQVGSHNLDGRERLSFTSPQDRLYFVRVIIPGSGQAPYDMDVIITP